eukprot:TRINITY_DN7632_c0_g1_i1.p1 TRINITY_DN7632_c0_g1~~TRINITY_DN7632_c0_g1_i1.p1  ORF type:complete len:753 (-),score=298.07 TRINITY_DN7632_c0_g1_i1:212-2443(-)
MQQLKLFVSPDFKGTFRCKKVEVLAKQLNVNLITIVMKQQAQVDELTPFKKLPVLLNGFDAIYGLDAILKYIGEDFPEKKMIGETEFHLAQIDQWLNFATNELDVPVIALISETKQALKDKAKKDVMARLLALNNALTFSTYLVNERLTLADLALACSVEAAFSSLSLKDKKPIGHVVRWLDLIQHQGCFTAPAQQGKKKKQQQKKKGKGQQQKQQQPKKGGNQKKGPIGATVTAKPVDASKPVVKKTKKPEDKLLEKELFVRTRVKLSDMLLADDEGASYIGKRVTVCGWAKTVRVQGGGEFAFVSLNDGSCFKSLQVVVSRAKTETGFDDVLANGTVGSSFRITGDLIESPAKGQLIEMQAVEAKVLGGADAKTYPLSKKKHSIEYLRSIQHLRPRTNIIGAVTRVRNACAFAAHQFFQKHGFMYIHTPLISCSDCEGAGEMFAVSTIIPEDASKDMPRTKEGKIDYSKDFFGQPAFLTVSGQLQVESFACSMGDVYTFGPTFRAENSHTSRHLSEFWMIEPEIAFADIVDDMNLAEDFLKYCTAYVLENCRGDLEFFQTAGVEKGLIARLENVVDEPFARITYTEAINLITDPKVMKKAKFEVKPEWGIDMGSEHERYLTEVIYKKPVIVTDYPKDFKAFYMKQNEDGKTCRAMDVLVPKIGEIMGGSQREEDLEKLHKRAEEMNVHIEGLWWYEDLRKYGSCPHAGFGLGFERLVMYVTGVDNIRDVIPFPRYPGHAEI